MNKRKKMKKNFQIKMRIGSGKLKGKLLLTYFDCGEVRDFTAKHPHKNEVVTKEKEGPRKFNKQGKHKWF